MSTPRSETKSPSPLQLPLYRALWIATLASNIGTWMQDVGAAWLMTSLSPSPIMVALVRAASSLPMFLMALPAGALADVVDRRRLLLVTQSWMLLVAAVLSLLSALDLATPWLLLSLTAALALGTAFNAPAWQAIMPELVSRAQLPHAIALNSLSINLARSVGPAIGGILIAASGPTATFALNALSFCGVIFVLYRWRRPTRTSVLPAERVMGAIRTGLRYVQHAPLLKNVLIRTSTFIVFGSAFWALLPAIARFEFGRGPAGYGIMLTFFGIGAVMAAMVSARLREKFSVNQLVAATILIFATFLFCLAWVRHFFIANLAMIAGGGAWLLLLSTFTSSVQAVVPSWVRGRALAVSILVLFGGLAAGSVLWGYVATTFGTPIALTSAGIGIVLGLFLTLQYPLHSGEELDLSPSVHWPAPALTKDLEPDQGPVVITVDYQIDPARRSEFQRAMQRVRTIRRRDGAISWGLLNDLEDPKRCMETFVVESWVEHLRQHERVTQADRKVLDKARSLHVGASPPRITHFLVDTAHTNKKSKKRRAGKGP